MELARQILAVMLVFALLGAAVWTLRRGPAVLIGWRRTGWPETAPGSKLGFGLGSALRSRLQREAPPMERVGRLALTPQHTLHLVRIQGREMVVATHPQGCSVVKASSAAGHRAVAGAAAPPGSGTSV